jgi:predicted methyltransferase
MYWRLGAGLAAAIAVAATVVLAQQQQRSPEEYAKFLEGADRVARMQVPRVVQALGLSPGMKAADIGSGSGLFTRPIARAVQPGGVATPSTSTPRC